MLCIQTCFSWCSNLCFCTRELKDVQCRYGFMPSRILPLYVFVRFVDLQIPVLVWWFCITLVGVAANNNSDELNNRIFSRMPLCYSCNKCIATLPSQAMLLTPRTTISKSPNNKEYAVIQASIAFFSLQCCTTLCMSMSCFCRMCRNSLLRCT